MNEVTPHQQLLYFEGFESVMYTTVAVRSTANALDDQALKTYLIIENVHGH